MFAVISRSETPDATPRIQCLPSSGMERSRGALDLVFSRRDGGNVASRVFQQGAMRARFPRPPRGADAPEAVLINTAGGLTGGDRFGLAVEVEAGAGAIVTSQACEKIYRSPGGAAHVDVRLKIGAAACLDWLPQSMILFDGAHFRRETHVEMEADSRFLAVEGVIFGRMAMGERVERGFLSDAVFLRRNGRLLHAERFEVADDIGALLARGTVLDGHRAMATLRYVAPDAEGRLEEARALLGQGPCVSAATAFDGMLIMRFAAPDGYELTRALSRVLTEFRGEALPRVWTI